MLNDGIPISIQGTLTIDHIDNNFGIIEFAKYIKDKYNISNIHIVPAQYNINDTKNWSNDLLEKLINSYSNYDIYNIEQILKGNFNNILYSSSFFDMLISLIVKRYNPLVCPSGTELTISTDGNLFPCFMLVNKTNIAPLGNLQIQDEEIKDNIHKYLVSVLKNNIASCNSCFAKNICHGCAGANLNESGNICHPSRVLCELTKERIKKIMEYISKLQKNKQDWTNFVKNFNVCFNKRDVTNNVC